MRTLLLVCNLVLFYAPIFAQTYSNVNSAFSINAYNNNNLFGAGVSACDFDGDGWDDLTFSLDNSVAIYKNNGGICESVDFGFIVDDNGKHPIWVDYDNDGDKDFFITQSMETNKLYRNEGDMTFTDVSAISGISQTSVPSYGCSWADYDRDGDLDVFICTYRYLYIGDDVYDYWNHLYQNNGDGTFTDVTIESGTHDGVSATFQSIWMDYNNDLWPDLYIANDREHPNRLYHNNGDGTFTEIGEETNTAITMVDAMSTSCGDFNNDGYEDIFVSNTSIGDCALLKNNGDGSFTDVAVSSNTDLQVLGWAGLWFDYNLDTHLDLYVCEYFPTTSFLPDPFMKNNGDETFTNINTSVFPFDYSNSYTGAVCDWNNDGYPEIAISNYSTQNANFWMNSGGNKSYVKIALEGVISNKDGIGTWIKVWAEGQQQVRYTNCGENYMGQNSQREMFGLNNATNVDSIQLLWPSGFVDKYYNIDVDSSYYFIEGQSFENSISYNGSTILCPGDSLTLDAGEYDSYLWNNGYDGRYITISQGGEFYVEVQSGEFSSTSPSVYIESVSHTSFEMNIENINCFGDETGLISIYESDSLQSIIWENNETDFTLDSLALGEYFFNLTDINGCVQYLGVTINEPDSLDVELSIENVSCFGESDAWVEVTIEGGTSPYVIDWFGEINSNLSSGEYSVSIIDSVNCSTSLNYTIEEPDSLWLEIINLDCSLNTINIDIESHGGSPPYDFLWNDESIEEDLSSENIIDDYSVIVTDQENCHYSLENISCPTLVMEHDYSEILLFPNPVDNTFTLSGLEHTYKSIRLFDLTGRKIWQAAKGSAKNNFNIENIKPGIYVLLVETGGKTVSFALMKN